ncbi:MAG: LysR family transcriptional regulator [Achromobacter pulmonis]|uniref:HTH-type transcriptional regulator DmlR n=1 Tax=Achromobacter pulmonis TaxID=1389932 RepID=A0A6S7DSP9_9BURK|nr:LysR family transcriptional regulator [Achromobacter pulmonis]MCF7769870.1 LysR family transcriptional regulator [Achromobacter pulmonis]MPT27780.1 LysR family transcriptional regulator [Achromobacter sp.]CAB3628042.1 HTH-type transcriptional regulator DmlR [Achromobacter pulmonis]CAB3856005.1 HTH-type transcriptional regulator DmlR [Achromobacter pulmonis]
MDRLSGLLPFVRSAELGSFAAAGRDLDLSPSAVGKAVARLEQDLHVRLFQRSTRRMQLTEEGRLFYERCKRILEDLDDAHATLSQTLREPRGRLRVSAPLVSYHFLLPVLPAFAARYPGVELDMDFNDRIVDLIGERVDVAIRSGDLPDSRLTARPLGRFRLRLYAAPDYLARHGTPQRPRDLERHQAVRFRYPNAGTLQEWPLALAAGEAAPRLAAAFTCNNMEALLGATIQGFGIACMPDFLARQALAAGRLNTVLDTQVNGAGRFQALWPSNRNLSPKVRVFVDFLGERLFRDSPP